MRATPPQPTKSSPSTQLRSPNALTVVNITRFCAPMSLPSQRLSTSRMYCPAGSCSSILPQVFFTLRKGLIFIQLMNRSFSMSIHCACGLLLFLNLCSVSSPQAMPRVLIGNSLPLEFFRAYSSLKKLLAAYPQGTAIWLEGSAAPVMLTERPRSALVSLSSQIFSRSLDATRSPRSCFLGMVLMYLLWFW